MVVITPDGIYHRIASVEKKAVPFVAWPKEGPKDLLAPEYKEVYWNYKKNPHSEEYPAKHFEDLAWSDTYLKKIILGESVPDVIKYNGLQCLVRRHESCSRRR